MSADGVTVRPIFLNYAQTDAVAADLVQTVLELAGVRVWRDTSEIWPGEDSRARIRRAVTDEALVFIALFSRASLALPKSPHREDLALAIGEMRQRPPQVPWLIPVRVDDCEIPDLDIGAGRTLRSLKPVDLSGPDRNAQLKRLVESVTRLDGGGPGPAVPPPGRRVPRSGWTRPRILWTGLGSAAVAAALIVGIALAMAPASHGHAPTGHHSATGRKTLPARHPSHQPTTPAGPTPQAAGRVVATFHGTGQENTPRFTVPATWKLVWKFDCSSSGADGLFQVYEDGGVGSVGVNELRKTAHGSTFGYSDAGSHYLEVNSGCQWQLKILAG